MATNNAINTPTITLGGTFTLIGAFTFAGTLSANTTVTFPVSGTLLSTLHYPAFGATAGKIIISDGTDYVSSTSIWPNTVGSVGKIIRSDGTTNAYTTSTFADTYTASNLLYSNGANTVTGLATANNAWLRTDGSGVPSLNTAGLPINKITAQVFLTPAGSQTYTPTSGMVYIIVTMLGAGGASGATQGTTGQTGASAPGNGGGIIQFIMTAAQVGASKTYTVGAGGVAGTVPSNTGGTGDSSLFADWVAAGGEGGAGCASSASSQTVTATSASSTNTVGTGTTILNKGTLLANTSWTTTTTFAHGAPGATGFFGAGGQSNVLVAAGTLAGSSGQTRGSGASGGATVNNNTDVAGGTGGNGAIYVVEYCSI
jgi:hypothetical protein